MRNDQLSSPFAGSRTGRRQRRFAVSRPFGLRNRQLTALLPRTLAIETSTRATWPAPLIRFDERQPLSRELPESRSPVAPRRSLRRLVRDTGGTRSGQPELAAP